MIALDTSNRINKRDSILDHIFVHDTDNSLINLLNLLNTDSDMSSLWFCGSRIDHMRCLGSEAIGWGISALPNDYLKAKMPKHHPHQIEIMIPIHGSIIVETYTPNIGLKTSIIIQGKMDNIIIQKEVCHRIKAPDGNYPDAAFFYVKTNVGQIPQDIGVKDNNNAPSGCINCMYHGANPHQCPIFQSYLIT